jgi:MFS family permease
VGTLRWGVLSTHDFRQLFSASAISQLGTQVSHLALPLVAVQALHASNLEIGILAGCGTAAFLLVGLPAGGWVDRTRRRNVLIASDVGRAAVLGSVPAAWACGILTMPQMYAVALLTGVFTVLFDVAYQSYLPHVVGRANLVEGNARLEAVRSVNRIAGPAAAGFAIQVLTAPLAVVVDAGTFLGSAILIGRIRSREERPVRAAGARLGREIVEGVRYVLGHRLLRPLAMCTGLANLFISMTMTMSVVVLARELRLGAGTIGVFFSAAAIGSLAGALLAGGVASRLGPGRTIWISTAVTAPFGLLMPLVQRGWFLWLVAAANAIFWAGTVVYNVTQVSVRQAVTPGRLLGRMNGTMRFFVWGTLPVGAFVGGLLGEYLGVRSALWVGALGVMLAFLPVFFSPLRAMRQPPAQMERGKVSASAAASSTAVSPYGTTQEGST